MEKRENTPQVRFEGDTNIWEQRKLSEIAEIVGGGTPSTANESYWNGDINWYSPVEIGSSPFAYESQKKITEEGLKHSSARMLPKDRTILFTSRAGIGDMAILKEPACTNQGFQSLVLKDGIDPYFIYSSGEGIKAKAMRIATGSVFPEISGKKLGDIEIRVPNNLEQQKIGAFFQQIDSAIALYQSKYEKLQLIRTALLGLMYPQEGYDTPQVRFEGIP